MIISSTLVIFIVVTTAAYVHRVGACEDLSKPDRDDLNFMLRIINSDESFVDSYDPETKNSTLHCEKSAVAKTEEGAG